MQVARGGLCFEGGREAYPDLGGVSDLVGPEGVEDKAGEEYFS